MSVNTLARRTDFERAIRMVNTRVYSEESGMAAAHFDAEQFDDGQRRLVEFEIISREILQRRFKSARRYAGRFLSKFLQADTLVVQEMPKTIPYPSHQENAVMED